LDRFVAVAGAYNTFYANGHVIMRGMDSFVADMQQALERSANREVRFSELICRDV
jgi:hypothetical protein